MFQGFESVCDKNSKILILGSFPSVKSRLEGFYYGNPQNRFWKMLSQVFNEQILCSNTIQEKKDFLHKHHIALSDVVSQSNLRGSADAVLEKSTFSLNEIPSLLPPNTKVRKIICNGKTAYNILIKEGVNIKNGQAYFNEIPIFCLPSTSSANPRFSLAEWQRAILE